MNKHRTYNQNQNTEKKFKKTYVGGIADELTEKDLLVAVEGVDYEAEKLVDLSLEGERLCFRHGRRRRLRLRIGESERAREI